MNNEAALRLLNKVGNCLIIASVANLFYQIAVHEFESDPSAAACYIIIFTICFTRTSCSYHNTYNLHVENMDDSAIKELLANSNHNSTFNSVD